MTSVSSARIPGLATGMDTDQMVKDMLTRDQNKVDKSKQREQITKWQQEEYRKMIKETKGFYDKYFSATSPNFILSSKVYSTITINSSDDNIIIANASAGANKIDYKFQVSEIAKPPKLESIVITKDEIMGKYIKEDSSIITINGKEITINKDDTIKTVVDNINKKFLGREVKAVYSEMTKKFSIEGIKTGKSSIINIEGELFNKLKMLSDTSVNINVVSKKIDETKTLKEQGISGDISINNTNITIEDSDNINTLIEEINKSIEGVNATIEDGQLKITTKSPDGIKLSGNPFEKMGINTNNGKYIKTQTIMGSNNSVKVYESDGKTLLNEISEEDNCFTIDNITYTTNSVTKDNNLVSMTSKTDSKNSAEKLEKFINDYNKIIEKIYDSVTEKKNRDYQPLTEAQKKDMDKEEIQKWEEKAKEGLLRNDKEMRAFMDDIKQAIFEPIGDMKMLLSDIGISTDDNYNKQGQLKLDVKKFKKELEVNGDVVFDTATKGLGKIKDIMYKYAGSSGGIFIKKSGMENSSTEINNLFSEQIRKQEQQIKKLTRKMQDKESELYKKFARLEANMNKLNSQMAYLMGSVGV